RAPRPCCGTRRNSVTSCWVHCRILCAPIDVTPSSPSSCSGSGCTRFWYATTPPWRRCANGTSGPGPVRSCCCPAHPVPAARPTGTPSPTSCAWTGRLQRGCAPCSLATKCSTVGGRCAARTARCSSPAPPRAARSSGAPSSRRSRRSWGRRRRLGAERARLVELEAQQEAAREQRVRWQVETAQGEAHLAAARARAERAAADAAEARRQGASLADEMATIDRELAAQTAQQGEWT